MTLHSPYCDQFAISTLLIEPDDQDSIGKELVDYIYSLLFSNWQGVKLTFFSDSHLAPKFFKVVANSKKVGRHFQRQTKSFFTLSAF